LRDGVKARARTASEDDAFAMGHGGVFGMADRLPQSGKVFADQTSRTIGFSLGVLTDAKLGEKLVLDSP
jgi:hypothetical protein